MVTAGDEEGELTYIGARGNSVIDYVIGNVEARGKIDRLAVKERTESDHLPICIYIQTADLKGTQDTEESTKDINLEQQIWTEKGIKKFREILSS